MIGIRGIALLEISETLSKTSVYKGTDVSDDFIINDISNVGIDEWAEYALTDIPTEPGIYTFRGSVMFSDEDNDCEYSVTCD